jgi:ABC-type nickel/cobalt efflux system permease component RcnA
MALLTIAGLWFLYLATMRTAAAEGTNPLWMFGSYALIAVAFGVCGWFMIRAQQRQYQREEREDQEKHARTMARLDRLQMDLDAIAGRTPPMRPTNRTSVPYLKLVE